VVAAPPAAAAFSVQCTELSCTFASPRGAVHALDRISLTLAPREFVCLVGPSGCGKSTLLRAIAGLVEPSAGAIHYTGTATGQAPEGGLVVQENGTFPWMTVLENVAFGLEMRGVPRAVRSGQARDYLDRVGLGDFAAHYPHELSVGMRQRVAIGRAFVADAPILLMDEPFGALDAQTRWVLQGELLRVWGERRPIVLFVTHDIHEAVLLGDRVLVMSGRPGRILEELTIPMPRPRNPKVTSPEGLEIAGHIWNLLEGEVRRGLALR
jgi:ABC-type nitrate/sulfonate/bicarbonate transport system ATPase subunit